MIEIVDWINKEVADGSIQLHKRIERLRCVADVSRTATFFNRPMVRLDAHQ